MTPINNTSNGRLSFCKCCDCFQLEFGNILISFSENDFITFKKHISNIDAESFLQKNKHFNSKRKIFISFGKCYFCLTAYELDELRVLLQLKKCTYNNDDCQKQLIIKEKIYPN